MEKRVLLISLPHNLYLSTLFARLLVNHNTIRRDCNGSLDNDAIILQRYSYLLILKGERFLNYFWNMLRTIGSASVAVRLSCVVNCSSRYRTRNSKPKYMHRRACPVWSDPAVHFRKTRDLFAFKLFLDAVCSSAFIQGDMKFIFTFILEYRFGEVRKLVWVDFRYTRGSC